MRRCIYSELRQYMAEIIPIMTGLADADGFKIWHSSVGVAGLPNTEISGAIMNAL